MALLDEVRLDLGISHHLKDSDIQTAIAACKLDLQGAGVKVVAENDPLIMQAVKLYCRAWYNYQGHGDRWEDGYDGLRKSLSMNSDYNGGGGVA